MSTTELPFNDVYAWTLTGTGVETRSCPNGEPNRFISSWALTISIPRGDAFDLQLGSVHFKVLDQAGAIAQDEPLYDVCDAEDQLYADYFEQSSVDPPDGLTAASRIILLTDGDLEPFNSRYRVDVLRIIEHLFRDSAVVVYCHNPHGALARQLADVMLLLSRDSRWVWHSDDYLWTKPPTLS